MMNETQQRLEYATHLLSEVVRCVPIVEPRWRTTQLYDECARFVNAETVPKRSAQVGDIYRKGNAVITVTAVGEDLIEWQMVAAGETSVHREPPATFYRLAKYSLEHGATFEPATI